MDAHRPVDSISWLPHPVAQDVHIKPMITLKDHALEVTCMSVKMPAEKAIPEHIHENQDDILYPLEGRAVMWVDGGDDFTLPPGVVVRVPKGVKHKIFDVSEDLLIYDVFCPAFI